MEPVLGLAGLGAPVNGRGDYGLSRGVLGKAIIASDFGCLPRLQV